MRDDFDLLGLILVIFGMLEGLMCTGLSIVSVVLERLILAQI